MTLASPAERRGARAANRERVVTSSEAQLRNTAREVSLTTGPRLERSDLVAGGLLTASVGGSLA